MLNRKYVLLVVTVLLMGVALGAGAETSTAAVDEKDIEVLTKSVYPSVVKVIAQDGIKKVATGVVIDKDGYIVTTALISPRDETITVMTADGKKHKAEFLGFDSQTHIAVIKVAGKNLAPLTAGKSADIGPGSWIGLVSFSPENTPAVSQGIVSSVSEERFRLNVWVVRGSSGSPVVDKNGKMIGMLRGVYAEESPVVFEFREREVVGSGYVFSRAEAPSAGMAVAIPIDIVRAVFQEIKEKGRVARGYLGVTITESEAGRVVISSVDKESPAELAKLKTGDIVLTFDGEEVTGASKLAADVRKTKPGKDIAVQVERSGKTVEVKVKMGEYSEADAWKEMEAKFPRLFTVPEPPEPPRPPRAEKAPVPPVAPRAPELRDFFGRWEKRKYIGVYLQETTKELAEYFGLKEGSGLLVTQFGEDSPAQKAGLKVGDVIFKADGKRVQTVAELSALIQDKKKGDKIKVEFMREKKVMSAMVEVAEEESGETWLFRGSDESNMYEDTLKMFTESSKLSGEAKKKYEEALKSYREQVKKWSEETARANKELQKKITGNLKSVYSLFIRI